jgi:hypothetical protein
MFYNILIEYFNKVFYKYCIKNFSQNNNMSSTPFQHPDADTSNYFYKMFNVGGDTIISAIMPKQLQKYESSSTTNTNQEEIITQQPDVDPNFINVMQMHSLHDK